jgi:DeoR/GlpR family transcriptional regulator of sugar metabolism
MAETTGTGPKHRLKRNDLVMNVFFFFSEEQDHTAAESIWELEVPMERIRQYLMTKTGATYRSNQWIYTQLRRYEQEVGVQLFRKLPGTSRDEFTLAIHRPMRSFHQKRHLYVTQKIKVANGVYDKIRNEVARRQIRRPVRILLGAGSTVYHLASILAEKSWQDETEYSVYTHNVGSLQTLLNHNVNYNRISVTVLNGTIDPVTYTIIGSDLSQFTEQEFDFVVQGTSVIHDGKLYIESAEERIAKEVLVRKCHGTKILVATKHEFRGEPIQDVPPYGSISDYDFVVVPRSSSTGERFEKEYDRIFDSYAHLFEPEIMNWNYTILRVVN